MDQFVALVYHDVYPGNSFDYGRLGRSATMYHVSERAFRAQLAVIAAAGLRCLDEAAMRAALAESGSGGIVLSFDDGWNGAVECAAPALAEHRMAAFFFITTGFIGRPLFVGLDALRRLDPSLFTVGSHGVTHRMLSGLPADAIRAELFDSKRRLEDVLGKSVTTLSIPGGAVDRRVLEIAEAAGYDCIFTSALALNPTASGRRGIARIGVKGSTDLATLRRWLAGDLRKEQVRAALLEVPKRLLGARTYSKLRRALLGETVGKGREHVFEP